jgi:hypothetical protein
VGLLIAVLIDELLNEEKYKSLLEQWKKESKGRKMNNKQQG